MVAREGSSKEVNSASAAAPMCLRVVGPAVHEAAPAVVDAAATHTELTDTVGTPGLGMHAPQAESDAELVAAVGTHAQAHRPSVRDIAPGIAHAPESLAVQPAASESEQNPHEEP